MAEESSINMEKVNYQIGDVVQFEGINDANVYTTYFLIIGVDRLLYYTVLCLWSSDPQLYGWQTGEQGDINRATINTYGKQVAQ